MTAPYNKGFTLLELMIVIAIIGIIASMAIPAFMKNIERSRLKEAAESLKSDLMYVRTRSIKESIPITVNRSTGTNGGWCYGFDKTGYECDCTETSELNITTSGAPKYCSAKRVAGFEKTNMSSVSSANTTFEPRRGETADANTCFSTTNFKLKVITSTVGRVRICTNTDAFAMPGFPDCDTDCP